MDAILDFLLAGQPAAHATPCICLKEERGPRAGLHLSWRERNGPRVGQPSHRGFGSTLTKDVIAHALDAKVAADFAPEGLCWTIEIPSRYVSEVSQ